VIGEVQRLLAQRIDVPKPTPAQVTKRQILFTSGYVAEGKPGAVRP
jgi:hypothetical protein